MKRFVEGTDRGQSTLFPECLEDWIDENNPVQAIDVFVDELDLAELGFDGIAPEFTGRPAYHPSVLLKLYIYGYLNRVQSSRRLEREAGRNVEVMWLLGRLAPDHKTIAAPQGQWRRDPSGLRPVYCTLPHHGAVDGTQRGHRRQQVQSSEQPGQELHSRQDGSTYGADRGERRALFTAAGHGGSAGAVRDT